MFDEITIYVKTELNSEFLLLDFESKALAPENIF